MLATTDSKHSKPTGFDDIIAPVEASLHALTAFLDNQSNEFETEVREMVAYCLKNQGKRIRPVLVFFSGWPITTENQDLLVRASAVVELVHLATLVHDDILDDATIRHNSDTASARWGNAAAVLLGDALFSQALKLASDFPTVEVCRAVSLATRRVCAGEIRQTFERGNANFALDEYFRVIELKTAELFKVSCFLGAHLNGYSETAVNAAAEFGRRLGIAYQIYDDLADILGDEKKIGKTLGTDLASGKYTLPTLLLLQDGHISSKELLEIKQSGKFDHEHFLGQLRDSGIIERVHEIFLKEIDAAEAAIISVQDEFQAGEYLLRLSEFVRLQMARYS
ncbi:polyprenyl synthetase family protein [Rubellicoccus peritrichatus]|uniref:Polyprenyl synthetase family protein n=1 Tax=Rubellicoccus peritrichatus TaxID=3080537 RepID=A0AAQ3QVN8_9BACT|nr:polyprenyl synthetase family protein [Puniceicoccus sp. CR14]WOO41100.1 polyprenyl synthetase family protein [Puniceicoccus sp. CR14]